MIEASSVPGLVTTFDDECRARWLVLVGVHAPQAVLIVLEVEGKRGEWLRRAEPHETIRPQVHCRRQARREHTTHRAVHTIGGNHEIGAFEVRYGVDLMLELQLDTLGGGLFLQHTEQCLTTD